MQAAKTMSQRKRENGHSRVRDNRGSSTQRGYGSRWQRASKGFLRANPLCIECSREGLTVPATVVDHIVPHKGDMVLFWESSNHQPLCKPCHDTKTAKEDGGFGR